MFEWFRKKKFLPGVHIVIGAGEAIDRLSILDIKCTRLHHSDAILKLRRQYHGLRDRLEAAGVECFDVSYYQFRTINEILWEAERDIRKSESPHNTLMLLHRIHTKNAERAKLKEEVDEAFGYSHLGEEKDYG